MKLPHVAATRRMSMRLFGENLLTRARLYGDLPMAGFAIGRLVVLWEGKREPELDLG